MKKRFTVITKDGKVVATCAATDAPQHGVFARLVAGPGQQAHDVEIEAPARLSDGKAIDEFHRKVELHLGRHR